jgi:hypothetical protein
MAGSEGLRHKLTPENKNARKRLLHIINDDNVKL